jgi:hypothetical protein
MLWDTTMRFLKKIGVYVCGTAYWASGIYFFPTVIGWDLGLAIALGFGLKMLSTLMS